MEIKNTNKNNALLIVFFLVVVSIASFIRIFPASLNASVIGFFVLLYLYYAKGEKWSLYLAIFLLSRILRRVISSKGELIPIIIIFVLGISFIHDYRNYPKKWKLIFGSFLVSVSLFQILSTMSLIFIASPITLTSLCLLAFICLSIFLLIIYFFIFARWLFFAAIFFILIAIFTFLIMTQTVFIIPFIMTSWLFAFLYRLLPAIVVVLIIILLIIKE